MKLKRLVLTICALFISATILDPHIAVAGFFGPSTFDECVLENMKGVTSDVAAAAIYNSCRHRFPLKKVPTEQHKDFDTLYRDQNAPKLSTEETNKLTGRAGLVGNSEYSATIYNGNNTVTITKVEITVSTFINRLPVSNRYSVDVDILPLKTVTFKFPVISGDDDAKYSWSFAAAYGHRHYDLR